MPTYNPYQPYPHYYQQMQNPLMQNAQQMNPTIQNGGFISVQSEEEARAWAVAPGNSVTFKNENAPYCYTKTMGFSQLDQPKFEKYRLVKEEDAPAEIAAPVPTNNYGELRTEVDELRDRILKLEKKLKKEEEDE